MLCNMWTASCGNNAKWKLLLTERREWLIWMRNAKMIVNIKTRVGRRLICPGPIQSSSYTSLYTCTDRVKIFAVIARKRQMNCTLVIVRPSPLFSPVDAPADATKFRLMGGMWVHCAKNGCCRHLVGVCALCVCVCVCVCVCTCACVFVWCDLEVHLCFCDDRRATLLK